MRELMTRIAEWQDRGLAVALATVVETWGSAPRQIGAKMAMTSNGDMVGSVSGGCVEAAVLEEGLEVLATGAPKLLRFGVTHDEAWAVGLSCGGQIEVFVEPVESGSVESDLPCMQSEILGELAACLERPELVVLATVVEGRNVGKQMLIWPRGETFGDLGSPRLNQRAALFAEQISASLQSGRKTFRWDEAEVDVFFEVYPPPSEVVIVGAVHVAVPLIALAKVLGFRTVVIDPRAAFATAERFRHVDRLLNQWPREALQEIHLHEASCLVVLSHDMKIDLPALEAGIRSPCRYIGALGSSKTHAKRVQALLESGCSEEEIQRIHSPIGFDLGGRKAEEVALAIMAEMVAAGYGRPTLQRQGG